MTLEELEAEAMKLDPPTRIELARRLTASLAAAEDTPSLAPSPPPPTDEEKERAWLQDAMRRSRELRERQVQTEPPERRGIFRPPAKEAAGDGKRRRSPRKPQPKRPAARRAKPARRRAPAKRAAPRSKPAKARARSRGKSRSPRR